MSKEAEGGIVAGSRPEQGGFAPRDHPVGQRGQQKGQRLGAGLQSGDFPEGIREFFDAAAGDDCVPQEQSAHFPGPAGFGGQAECLRRRGKGAVREKEQVVPLPQGLIAGLLIQLVAEVQPLGFVFRRGNDAAGQLRNGGNSRFGAQGNVRGIGRPVQIVQVPGAGHALHPCLPGGCAAGVAVGQQKAARQSLHRQRGLQVVGISPEPPVYPGQLFRADAELARGKPAKLHLKNFPAEMGLRDTHAMSRPSAAPAASSARAWARQ